MKKTTHTFGPLSIYQIKGSFAWAFIFKWNSFHFLRLTSIPKGSFVKIGKKRSVYFQGFTRKPFKIYG